MSVSTEELKNIKAFVFDVDGVLSKDILPINRMGILVRTSNVKDGFAIRMALKAGFRIAIITGGYSNRLRLRYKQLGVNFYYQGVRNKVQSLTHFLNKTQIRSEQVLFMGDDLVDYNVMKEVGVPACPADAVEDIKLISKYISEQKGGEGCVRDVIEKVMRKQNKWLTTEMLHARAF